MQEAHGSPRLPRSFYLLLMSQTISLVGSQVTILAIPLVVSLSGHVGRTGAWLAARGLADRHLLRADRDTRRRGIIPAGDGATPVRSDDAGEESIRYALAPPELHGRVNASIRTAVWGLAPLGALLGGACGMWLDSRTTLLLSGTMIAAATGWIVTSPLWAVLTPDLAEVNADLTSESAARTTQEDPAPPFCLAPGNARADSTRRPDSHRSPSPAPTVSVPRRLGVPHHEVH